MSDDCGEIRVGRTREFPFFQVDTAVLDDEELSMKAKMVYVSLCRFADRHFQCYPSLNTIARKSGCTKPTVLAGLKELEDKGYLRRENRHANGESKSNFYNLMPGGGKIALPGGSKEALPPGQIALPGGGKIALPPGQIALPELYPLNQTNSEQEQNNKKPRIELSAESEDLARLLVSLHQEHWDRNYNPEEKNIQGWRKDIDLLHRKDGRSWADIELVIRYAKTMPMQNGFTWATNIMSGAKLREKFDKLIVEARAKSSRPAFSVVKLQYPARRELSEVEKAANRAKAAEYTEGLL